MVIDSRAWAPSRRRFLYSVPGSLTLSTRYNDVSNWLLENVGTYEKDWDYRWVKNEFCFKTREDKVKFILKWL